MLLVRALVALALFVVATKTAAYVLPGDEEPSASPSPAPIVESSPGSQEPGISPSLELEPSDTSSPSPSLLSGRPGGSEDPEPSPLVEIPTPIPLPSAPAVPTPTLPPLPTPLPTPEPTPFCVPPPGCPIRVGNLCISVDPPVPICVGGQSGE